MVNTLISPKRLERLIWLIVLAIGYFAFRAVFDYARGVNLVENGRVKGAVGGFQQNPNDLALNMVAFLPLAALVALRAPTLVRALAASALRRADDGRDRRIAIARRLPRPRRRCSLVLGGYLLRRRPGDRAGAALVARAGAPLLPASYWHRISSITDESKDETGSREARQILLRESFDAFLEHPLTGVGAGPVQELQPGRPAGGVARSHNVWLQVAAELGIFGLLAFMFLVVRAAMAGARCAGCCVAPDTARRARAGRRRAADATVTRAEVSWLRAHSAAMGAALAGWFVCAFFASVAYNWTFYYLLALAVAPREILLRSAAPRVAARSRRPPPAIRVQEVARVTSVAAARALDGSRELDARIGRRSDRRRILVDGRTPVNFTMVAPVVRAPWPRPARGVLLHGQRGAGPAGRESIARRPGVRHDPPAPRRADEVRRVPGVRFHVGDRCRAARAASRCSTASAASTASTRRPRRCASGTGCSSSTSGGCATSSAAGAIDRRQSGDPARRHAEGRLPGRRRLDRDAVLESLGLDPSRPTVLYAPTWSPASSLNAMGIELDRRPAAAADQPDRQAARPLARSARAVFRAASTGWRGSSRCLAAGTRRDRPRSRHHPVSGRGRPDDHRPQLRRLRVPAARSSDRPHPSPGADSSWRTSIPTTSSCWRRSRSRSTTSARRARAPSSGGSRVPAAQRRPPARVAADLFYRPGGATRAIGRASLRAHRARAAPRCSSPTEATMPAVSVIMPAYNVAPYIGDGDRVGRWPRRSPISS